MPGKRLTPEQIIGVLRQAEVELAQGRSLGEVCRGLGVSEASFYRWRAEYGGLKVDQARWLDRKHDHFRAPPGQSGNTVQYAGVLGRDRHDLRSGRASPLPRPGDGPIGRLGRPAQAPGCCGDGTMRPRRGWAREAGPCSLSPSARGCRSRHSTTCGNGWGAAVRPTRGGSIRPPPSPPRSAPPCRARPPAAPWRSPAGPVGSGSRAAPSRS